MKIDLQQQLNISKDHARQGRYDEALMILDNLLESNPENIMIYCVKAAVYNHFNDHLQIEKTLQQALVYDPDNHLVLTLLCESYNRQKKYSETLKIADKLIKKEQNTAEILKVYTVALRESGRTEEAIAILKQYIDENPSDVRVIYILAGIYLALQKIYDAEKYYNTILALEPDNCDVLYKLCFILNILFDKNDKDDLSRADHLANRLMDLTKDKLSVAQWTQSIALTSIDFELQDKLGDKKDLLAYWADNMLNIAFVFQRSRVKTMQDRIDLLEAHRSWGSNVETNTDTSAIKRKVRQNLNNKIRLGITSPDFRHNHIGHYIWPLVNNINKDKFEIYCYAQWPEDKDSLQHEFAAIAHSFKKCPLTMDDKSIAQTIADDCLDALVETGTWFLKSTLLAYKPAPIQISWLDYPHSMGLPTAIDYIVVDPYIKPDPSLLLEKPMVLPESWIVMDEIGFAPVPITDSLPQERNGQITFGTMYRPWRLTEETFRVWAGIMNAVPNSRFIYIRPETNSKIVRDNFYKNMEKHGINRNRIFFISTQSDFMKYLNEIDIAFDTFPDTGATTTSYLLWMGLPLVTLVGPCFFERLSYSALNNCGLGDLCAFNPKEYHDIALQLVADKERRRHIRKNLRSWILNGPLGQSKRFADNMGNAIADVLGRG